MSAQPKNAIVGVPFEPSGVLAPLFEHGAPVDEARRDLLRAFWALPAPLNEIVLRYYGARIRRNGDRPVLGEYLPWLIGDVVGVSPGVASLVAPAVLMLNAYICLVDDIIDESSPKEASQLMIGCGLVLQRATVSLLSLYPADELVQDEYLRCANQMALAVSSGVRERGGTGSDYGLIDDYSHGLKYTIANLTGFCLLRSEDRVSEAPTYDSKIRAITAAFQLLDDLTDFEEDWRAGQDTLPAVAIRRRFANLGQHTSRTDLFAALVFSGGLEESILAVGRLLDVELPEPWSASPTGRSVAALVRETNSILAEVRHARGLGRDIWSPDASGLATSLADPQSVALLEKLRTRLTAIAQSS